MEQANVRSRRRHTSRLKQQVLAQCVEPGASVARVALTHGLNANLVHKWRREANATGSAGALTVSESFIPVTVAADAAVPLSDIRIELRRGAMAINISWPRDAATECGAWLREILR